MRAFAGILLTTLVAAVGASIAADEKPAAEAAPGASGASAAKGPRPNHCVDCHSTPDI